MYVYSSKRLLKDIAFLILFFIVSYITFWLTFHYEALRVFLDTISKNVMGLYASPFFLISIVVLGIILLGSGIRIYLSSWRGEASAILGVALIGAGVLMLVFFAITILERFFTIVSEFTKYYTP